MKFYLQALNNQNIDKLIQLLKKTDLLLIFSKPIVNACLILDVLLKLLFNIFWWKKESF